MHKHRINGNLGCFGQLYYQHNVQLRSRNIIFYPKLEKWTFWQCAKGVQHGISLWNTRTDLQYICRAEEASVLPALYISLHRSKFTGVSIYSILSSFGSQSKDEIHCSADQSNNLLTLHIKTWQSTELAPYWGQLQKYFKKQDVQNECGISTNAFTISRFPFNRAALVDGGNSRDMSGVCSGSVSNIINYQ